MAMRNGARQHLQEVRLLNFTLGDGDIRDFADLFRSTELMTWVGSRCRVVLHKNVVIFTSTFNAILPTLGDIM